MINGITSRIYIRSPQTAADKGTKATNLMGWGSSVILLFVCRLEPFCVSCESKGAGLPLEDDVDLKLTRKVALVTGSTAGIGFAIAQSLASEGAHVYVNGRTQQRVDAAIEAIRSHAPAVKVDGIAADFSGSDGAKAVMAKLPAVDVLVNNVGIFEPKPFAEIPDADWYRFFEINVMSGVHYVDLEKTIPVRIGDLRKWLGLEYSHIVHQHIYCRQFCHNRLRTVRTRKVRRNAVNLDGRSMRPNRLNRGIHALLCASVHIDMRAFARKRLGDRKPDPRRRSGYQCNFSSEFQIHIILQRKASPFGFATHAKRF